MKKLLLSVATSAMLLLSTPASANYSSAEMLASLQHPTDLTAVIYIAAVTDTMQATKQICSKTPIEMKHVFELTEIILVKHADIRAMQAADMLSLLLTKMFPCYQKNT